MRRIAVLIAGAAVAVAGMLAYALPGDAAKVGTLRDVALIGGTEVPGPGDSDGFGLAEVRVNPDGRVCWEISASAVRPIAAAHIHAAPRGVAGPIVVTLDPIDSGCASIKGNLARVIAEHPRQFYVNLHNAEFPEGALRGQLLR